MYVCLCVPVCVYVCMFPEARRGQQMDDLEMELHIVVNNHVGGGN